MNHQDWDTVVINKGNKRSQGVSKEQEVNQARRKGEDVETLKKFAGGSNKAKPPPVNASKIEQDDGDYHVDRVSFSFSKALQQARMSKGLTQAQLAQLISEKASVINDYENGRAIPEGAVISKLSRHLGVKLPAAKAPRRKLPDVEAK